MEKKEESQPTNLSQVGDRKVKTYPIEIVKVNERGEIVQRQQKQVKYSVETLPGGVEIELAKINGGTFMMGSPEGEGEYWEHPQHSVIVSSFLMGKYPITQAQWKAIAKLDKIESYVRSDPSYFKGDKRPVTNINWNECVEFCKRLSKLTGRKYRLPSEAQWEYACRAGTTTPFYVGETITTDLANYRGTDCEYHGKIYPGTYASEPKGQYREEITPVGKFPPNAFGLYDMHGNIWEWCADDWHSNYEGAPSHSSTWNSNDNNKTKVIRGGSYKGTPHDCRSAYRYFNLARADFYGFRVVCVSPRT